MVTAGKFFATVALTAGCALAAGMAGPASAHNRMPLSPNANASEGAQTAAVDQVVWSARRDITESRAYDHLLETDPAFRHARMQKECGPINNAALHKSCLASFSRYEPLMASAATTPKNEQAPRTGRNASANETAEGSSSQIGTGQTPNPPYHQPSRTYPGQVTGYPPAWSPAKPGPRPASNKH